MVSRLSTPPLSVQPRTPPTPKHGGMYDNYEPYPTRKSARVSSRQRAAHTPEPPSSDDFHGTFTSNNISGDGGYMAMEGINQSPSLAVTKKRGSRSSLAGDARRVSGALNEENTASAAAALGLTPKKRSIQTATTMRNNGMLPTPVKTPKKSPNTTSPAITSIARNLFPVRHESVEDAMPTPKRARKKYTGYTLDSFRAVDAEAPIQIYTDSHDRVPEEDLSADNPFYGETSAARSDPIKRSRRRGKVTIPGEGEITLEEAEKREDGMVCVFRGMYKFRKFAEMDDADAEPVGTAIDAQLAAELDSTIPSRLRGPLTRSSVKPRLLFPSAEQTAARQQKLQEKKPQLTDDEEAMTDIEHMPHEVASPEEDMEDVMATPVAPKFAPAPNTPPSTARTTRYMNLDGAADEPSPRETRSSGPRSGAKVNAFAGWKRTKAGAATNSKKRDADKITGGGDTSKRQRGARSQAAS